MLQGTVIRGTTPEHEFELPYPKETVEKIFIVYGQSNKPLFIKTENDCQITDGKITVSLSQEETFLFNAKKHLNIELRIKLTNGKVLRAEEPIVLRVIDSMSEEVIN